MAIRPESTKMMVKESNGLKHACVTAAFYFAEAYLNGIAFDFYVDNEKSLSEKEVELLTEWDARKKRPRHLGLRDKFLQYSRIITKSQQPPLREDNCPELEFFLTRAKLLRDSVVHASPKLEPDLFEPIKEKSFHNPQMTACEEVVDKTIVLVRKVEVTVRGNDGRLDWLKDRGAEGFFDESVFS